MHERPPSNEALDALVSLFRNRPVAVLTGAGISTESGIPDYRGPETRRRARNPVQLREFLRSSAARRRYWARSLLGWPRIASARPNAAHVALFELERAGVLSGLVTQNVDGLHHDAGSVDGIELHGALRRVVCMSCDAVSSRAALQRELEARNPRFRALVAELAPDGDSELEDSLLEAFAVVDCACCGGPLRPDVVFFGENVPRERVERAFAIVERAAALIVVGSSLAVFSGLRFVHAAAKQQIPIGIVTLGESRGDPLATVRVQATAGACLSAVRDALLG